MCLVCMCIINFRIVKIRTRLLFHEVTTRKKYREKSWRKRNNCIFMKRYSEYLRMCAYYKHQSICRRNRRFILLRAATKLATALLANVNCFFARLSIQRLTAKHTALCNFAACRLQSLKYMALLQQIYFKYRFSCVCCTFRKKYFRRCNT